MPSHPDLKYSRPVTGIILLVTGALLLLWLIWPRASEKKKKNESSSVERTGTQSSQKNFQSRSTYPKQDLHGSPFRPGDARGNYKYLFNKAKNADRFLISRKLHPDHLPESDAPDGRDLWIQDESGNERKVSDNVYRARFSPDGNKIAYTTADAKLHVEDLSGNKLGELEGAYEPNWHPDSSGRVVAKVPPRRQVVEHQNG